MSMLILLWMLVTVSLPVTAQHVIQVNPRRGYDNKYCLEKRFSCKTLSYALNNVNYSNTTVELSGGSIILSTAYTLSILSNFTIVGNGITTTTIQCNSTNTGLSFVGMSNLTIANLTISNCSMLQDSTTWNGSSLVQYPSAITIHNSTNVTIHSVSFTLNNGIGLSVVNTGGVVTIYGSTFDGNYVSDNDHHPGGGGLYIEFPFCFSDKYPDSVPPQNILNSNSSYTISDCHFYNNTAVKLNPPPLDEDVTPFPCAEQTFGHGGGMSVFFRGNSTNNIINIINTDFVNNTAVWGGGLFVEFNHYTNNNTLTVEYSQFSDNSCVDSDNPDGTVGGGVQIAYAPYGSSILPSHNSVTFSQCSFTHNTAYWGGGVSYVIVTERHATGTNSLYFTNCRWQHNEAKFGAAVDLSLYRSLTSGVAQAVVFESCSFVNNNAVYNIMIGQFELQGAGTVYANSIPICLKEQIEFITNAGSALVLSTSYINISDECNVTFIENKGLRGGAISLLTSSWMIVGKNTNISFARNQADEVGGAIFAEVYNEHNVISEWNCFIQYSDTTTSPDEWNTTIIFQDNECDRKGHSIYATTIRCCVWGKHYASIDDNDVREVFHWNSFKFTGTSSLADTNEIATATTYYSIPASGTKVTVSPGEKHHLQLNQSDDEGHRANNIFFVQSSNPKIGSLDNRSIYIYSDIMQMYGEPDTTVNVTLTSMGPMASTATLNITFGDCPPGYVVDDSNKPSNKVSCKCANEYPTRLPGIDSCDDDLYQAYITKYYWGGIYVKTEYHDALVTEEQLFVTALCPQGYCYHDSQYKTLLPNDKSNVDFCSEKNRNGTICGECKDGYSISSRLTCIQCDNGTMKGIFLFILYECLPALLFVYAILIFNINIIGYWNSLIFYFQIVGTLNLYARKSPDDYNDVVAIFIRIHQNIFEIWNLEFFQNVIPQTCYINGMKNIFELNWLRMTTLLFPIGLIVVLCMFKYYCACFWCNNLPICNRCEPNYNRVTRIWQSWFGEASLLHGLAAFIVVSYTRVTLLSIYFLIFTPLYHDHTSTFETRVYLVGTMKYFSKEHLVYALPAIFLLSISAMLPCYLILRPLLLRKIFPRCLAEGQRDRCDPPCCCWGSHGTRGKVNQMLKEFYGPFKDNRQWYSGLFFFYRFIFYVILAFTPSLEIQYCVQQCVLIFMLLVHSLAQPYDEKFNVANIVDALIFCNLNLINALAVYNYYSVVDVQGESNAAVISQLVLVYLPLVYVPVRFFWWARKACCRYDRPNDQGEQQGEQAPILGRNNNVRNYNGRELILSARSADSFNMEEQREEQREMMEESFQQHTINEGSYVVVNRD